MAQQNINFGTAAPNDGENTSTAFPKIEANFTELYTQTREKLTANRTYYVATTGSDSNTGLSAGVPFATLQKAHAVASLLDTNGFTVVVNIADGTYTAGVVAAGGPVGITSSLQYQFVGNTTSPQNVIISTTSADCFSFGDSAGGRALAYLNGMELRTTTAGHCIQVYDGSAIKFGDKFRFGACAQAHMYCHTGGYIIDSPPGYTVSGSAGQHWNIAGQGKVICHGVTIDFPNAITFSAFAVVSQGGLLIVDGNTWTNKANVSGLRFSVNSGGYIFTSSTDPAYLPGTVVGVEDTDGIYDGYYGQPWTTYTPTLSTGTGSLTAASATGRYKADARTRTVFFQIIATITTNGTGASWLNATLPSVVVAALIPSQNSAAVGWLPLGGIGAVVGNINASNNTMNIVKYDGTYPGATGAVITVAGHYEY